MVHANHPPSHRSKQRGGEGGREIKPSSQPPAHLDPTTLSNAYKHVKTMRKTMDYFFAHGPLRKIMRGDCGVVLCYTTMTAWFCINATLGMRMFS